MGDLSSVWAKGYCPPPACVSQSCDCGRTVEVAADGHRLVTFLGRIQDSQTDLSEDDVTVNNSSFQAYLYCLLMLLLVIIITVL